MVVAVSVLVTLSIVPLGTATQSRTSAFVFPLPVGPGGTTFEVSESAPHLCEQARSDANLSSDRSFTLTWSANESAALVHVKLVAVGVFPWTDFYDVSNVSSGSFSANASTELGVVCAPSLELIGTASSNVVLTLRFALECAYSVAAPIL